MAMRFAYLMCVAMVIVTSGCAAEPGGNCSSELHTGTVIAEERLNGSVVNFVRVSEVIDVVDGEEVLGDEIKVVRFRDGNGCAGDEVAYYGYGGGEPILEDSFIHSVQGEPNLFAIVSWPNSHSGLGMHGRMYSVYAYHIVDGNLVVNRVVAEKQELAGGVEGSVEGGIPSSFEGVSREGVISLLKRFGLE